MALGPVQRTLQATRLFCSASALAIALCWAGASNATEINSTCVDFTPERRALFGDLHVHTSLSSDAFVFATRTRPDDAYRFASGAGPARMDVITKSGVTRAEAEIPRPLDFAAVTDHAEMIGAPVVCTTPGNPGYDSEICARFRAPWKAMGTLAEGVATIVKMLGDLDSDAVCGEGGVNGSRCTQGMATAWDEIQDSAARFDAPCRFSTFVAYEYSANPELSKTHRNVIFKNAEVPALPVSSRTTPEALGLWRSLAKECIDPGTGCDAITIPHNPNLSNGRIFSVEPFLDDDPSTENEADLARREHAQLRHDLEPLVEMFQIKGDSECRGDLAGILGDTDEFCGFEKYRTPLTSPPEDCGDGVGGGALMGRGCFTRRDFARYAVARGMFEQERLGVNPFKVGFIGSTDIHEGLPGDTDDWIRDGVQRPQRLNSFGRDNPGGLAGVWAEENTRDSVFDAMKRRETFATSGPRIRLRLFGGWDLPKDLCTRPDMAKRAYASGVPMGGDLPAITRAGKNGSPTFYASALADPGVEHHPGGLLQRLQIIKVTSDAQGNAIQRVVDIAGGDNDARVEATTCEPVGAGAASLCSGWTDPNFDPNTPAAYYARVIENPSCRAAARACGRLEANDRPEACDDPKLTRIAQERAWSSPIWFTP
jgi:hypothetical protein